MSVPFPKATEKYMTALLVRYSPARDKERETFATKAEAEANKLESVFQALPSGDPQLPGARDQAAAAREKAEVARQEIDERTAAESAFALVNDALNLQVDKASGLLTYNGLVAALATILWTERCIRPGWEFLLLFLFLAVLISSVLALRAIFSWWETPDVYSEPVTNLRASITLAARRATLGNWAVVATLFSTAFVAAWVALSTKPPSSSSVKQPPFSLPDSVHLKCTELERPSGHGLAPGDDIDCWIVK